MASFTLSVSDEFKSQLKAHKWVNWSEVAREEAQKKLIFERYVKTGDISNEDWAFCEALDWHPVDELPFKEDFLKRIAAAKKERSRKIKSISEIFA